MSLATLVQRWFDGYAEDRITPPTFEEFVAKEAIIALMNAIQSETFYERGCPTCGSVVSDDNATHEALIDLIVIRKHCLAKGESK